MSFKKWLNDHSLTVSTVGISLLVLMLYMARESLYRQFGVPYLKLENGMQDWTYRLGKLAPKDPRIYFLYDDAASHNLDHLWPEDFEDAPVLKKMKRSGVWPREVFAAILERLAGAGAKVVGFDYVFQGESPESDPAFKKALDQYRNQVVVGSQLDDANVSNQVSRALNPPSRSLIASVSDPRVGFINVFPDADETVRRFPLRITLEEMAGLHALPDATEFESFPVRMLKMAGYGDLVPEGRERRLIRFAYKGETRADLQRPQSVANIFVQSYWESNYQKGEFFRDKIVLVGPSGNLFKDVGESPFGTIGGPEFHLNVMNALLSGNFMHQSPFWLDLSLIFAGGLVAYCVGRYVKNPLVRMFCLITMGVGFFGCALWLFNHYALIIPTFSPLVALVGSGALASVWQQLRERIEKAKLRKTFERYVSRDVVKELLDNPQSYLNTVGGVRKNVTVLFSDVRGFTTITESGDAHALVQQLNEYFSHMVGLVFENRGTLDKFIGDAVMAQWGGIYTEGEKQDAINAVHTAVQMRKRLAKLNESWIPQGKLELRIGIGINHGEVIVGNIGCEAKMEVSMIGDAVNTASRFEGMTKEFHVDFLIGGTVEALVRDAFHVRTVSLTLPKGKTKPVEVFTVIDDLEPGVPPPAWLSSYENGVKHYRGQRFKEASECFREVLKLLPGDWLTMEYLRWCQDYLESPPAPGWNGVYVMHKK